VQESNLSKLKRLRAQVTPCKSTTTIFRMSSAAIRANFTNMSPYYSHAEGDQFSSGFALIGANNADSRRNL
jgi:hypothetical protein